MKGPMINGEWYDLIVLHVKEKDSFGRPKLVSVMYDDDKVRIEGGEEFLTAFVKSETVTAKTQGNA